MVHDLRFTFFLCKMSTPLLSDFDESTFPLLSGPEGQPMNGLGIPDSSDNENNTFKRFRIRRVHTEPEENKSNPVYPFGSESYEKEDLVRSARHVVKMKQQLVLAYEDFGEPEQQKLLSQMIYNSLKRIEERDNVWVGKQLNNQTKKSFSWYWCTVISVTKPWEHDGMEINIRLVDDFGDQHAHSLPLNRLLTPSSLKTWPIWPLLYNHAECTRTLIEAVSPHPVCHFLRK